MTAATIPGLLTLLFTATAVIAQQPDEISRRDDKDVWLGGLGSLDDHQLSWNSATLEMDDQDSESRGRLKTDNNRIYPVSISRDEENVTLILKRRSGERKFVGQMVNGVLVASAEDGTSPNRLVLRQVQPLSSEDLSELTGIYSDDGHRVSFRPRKAGLAMTDYQTGKIRFLYPVGPDRFVAGSAIAIPDPVEFQYQFQRDDKQAVTGVEVRQKDNETFVARRRPRPRQEEFSYASFDGTKICGSLYRPPGDGPFPAVVWVHGSGKANRGGAGSWTMYLADLGFAVLAVDKRGVGKSEGDYHLPGGGRDNFPHMRRRSKDVAAAVRALAELDDIKSDRIGLVGASQAGWVIPMTVGQTDIAFAMILSGGATPLSIEGRYSQMASERSSGSNLPPVDQLIEELRSYEPDDEGIDTELSQMSYPCLWLYGYRDRSNPSQLCVERLNAIGDKHGRDFTIKVFPEGNHGLLDCRYGGGAENGTLDHVVPDLYDSIEAWLAEKKIMPK